jgi:hypothetical protein
VDRLLREKAIPKDKAAGRWELARRAEARRRENPGTDCKPVERGWRLGCAEFREERQRIPGSSQKKYKYRGLTRAWNNFDAHGRIYCEQFA